MNFTVIATVIRWCRVECGYIRYRGYQIRRFTSFRALRLPPLITRSPSSNNNWKKGRLIDTRFRPRNQASHGRRAASMVDGAGLRAVLPNLLTEWIHLVVLPWVRVRCMLPVSSVRVKVSASQRPQNQQSPMPRFLYEHPCCIPATFVRSAWNFLTEDLLSACTLSSFSAGDLTSPRSTGWLYSTQHIDKPS